MLKAISEEIRIRILNLLKDGELCVCEIEHILEINQSNASRHLSRLMNAKLIQYEKRALYVYYKLNEKALHEYPAVKELIYTELSRLEQCRIDSDRLHEHKESGITCDMLKNEKQCNKTY